MRLSFNHFDASQNISLHSKPFVLKIFWPLRRRTIFNKIQHNSNSFFRSTVRFYLCVRICEWEWYNLLFDTLILFVQPYDFIRKFELREKSSRSFSIFKRFVYNTCSSISAAILARVILLTNVFFVRISIKFSYRRLQTY